MNYFWGINNSKNNSIQFWLFASINYRKNYITGVGVSISKFTKT